MRRISNLNNLLTCLGLLAFSSVYAIPAYTQGIALGQADLIRQLRETGTTLKEYAEKHDHYPNNTEEMDDLLKLLYSRISLTSPDSTVQVAQNGRYRTFYQFAIGIDPSYKSTPIVNNVPQVSPSLVMPASSIVLMTDGQDEIVAWAAGVDGRPIELEQGKGPMHYYNKIEPKDQSSNSK